MGHYSMEQAIAKLRDQNPKYAPAAYHFIRRALDHSLRNLKSSDADHPAHVTGRELLEGFRALALEEFGPLAKTVLEDWGITTCGEVGEVVFQLVSLGVLGKSEDDKLDDFEELWSFTEVFETPFRPRPAVTKASPVTTRSTGLSSTKTDRKRPASSPTASKKQ